MAAMAIAGALPFSASLTRLTSTSTATNSCVAHRNIHSSFLSASGSSASSSITGTNGYLGTVLQVNQSSMQKEDCRHGASILKVEAAKRVGLNRGVALNATLIAQEGNEQQVAELCKSIVDWAREKQKDKKSGIVAFECSSDLFESNVFHFWERYSNFLHMNDVRASPEHVKFMNDVRPLLKQPVGLAAYEYKDGKIGNCCIGIGPKGEGGLDDATGQNKGAAGASYKQQSSTVAPGDAADEEKYTWGLKEAIAKTAKKSPDSEEELENRDKQKSDGWDFKKLFGLSKK